MIVIKGAYNEAKIYIDEIDSSTEGQIKNLCEQSFMNNCKIRIMPDVHAGIGCTIGTTMTIHDKVVPNMVGVDIGCGMETLKLRSQKIDFEKLDRLIYERIPSGRDIRKEPHRYNEQIDMNKLRCFQHVNIKRAVYSIGTLGGGNHFIEIDKDEKGILYLVIHSGSRHIGNETAKYHQDQGFRALNRKNNERLEKLKSLGKHKRIKAGTEEIDSDGEFAAIPHALAYVEGEMFDDYIHDMKIIQQFAVLNRRAMADEIIKGMKLEVEEQFTTVHNYIDTESMILRKGAVSAKNGEMLLIPINMRDGSLICLGKGNEDWNYSAPHGAGRLMSRKSAMESFSLSDFKKEMEGIYTTCVRKDTLDECPMVYKRMMDIINNIEETAKIVKVIRPVYNFKASE
jgi:RNA-splicing ligase RtcB